MDTRTTIAAISLTLLWLATGLAGFLAAPTQLAAQTHSQMLTAHPRMP
jgi:hypothetical protein